MRQHEEIENCGFISKAKLFSDAENNILKVRFIVHKKRYADIIKRKEDTTMTIEEALHIMFDGVDLNDIKYLLCCKRKSVNQWKD